MNPLARNISGARGSPNTNFSLRNTAQMNGHRISSAASSGPRSFQNGGARNFNNNGNGNNANSVFKHTGPYKNINIGRYNNNGNDNNRQYNNNNNGQYNNGYGNGNGNNNRRYNDRRPYNNNGNGNVYHNRQNQNNHNNGQYNNGNGNGNPNSNYQGRNFNPNYKGKKFDPNFHGPGEPVLGPQGGTVADARYGNRNNQFNSSSPSPPSPRNNRRRYRNTRYLPLPVKFNNALADFDTLMIDAPSDEPNDIEMPDAPPLPVDTRIDAFTAGAQALQQTALAMIRMAFQLEESNNST